MASFSPKVILEAFSPEGDLAVRFRNRTQARPLIPLRASINEYTNAELVELLRWITSDGQLRTDEELLTEVVPLLGFSRRGARIERAVRDAIRIYRQSS